jgi:CubicO group peptidase (beta-lactamase class C family)
MPTRRHLVPRVRCSSRCAEHRNGPTAGYAATASPDHAVALDAYFQQAARDRTIPGFAVTIVKDDRVVLAKGYGTRWAETATAVDEHTVFYTGSVTKQFTVVALALVAADGKLRIDDLGQTCRRSRSPTLR